MKKQNIEDFKEMKLFYMILQWGTYVINTFVKNYGIHNTKSET